MGFFFAASYDARLLGAGVTMNMNPGYSMQPSSAGLLSAELINDRVNVSGIGHVPGADAEAIREQLRNGLRNDLPRSLERIVANVLTYPLQGPLATSCDNSAQCLPRVRDKMNLACLGGDRIACAGAAAVSANNFVCESGGCSFHPIVQGVNVLPDELELVFAPDPTNLAAPLDTFYRLLAARLDVEICGPTLPRRRSENASLPLLQLGQADVGSPSIPCSELGF